MPTTNVMAAQALENPEHIGHLGGDVPSLLVIACACSFVPRGTAATSLASGKN